MAQATLTATTLRLLFETGVDEKGAAIYRVKSFNNVKKEATTDQLHQAAQAFSVLCMDPLSSIERNDNSEIIG